MEMAAVAPELESRDPLGCRSLFLFARVRRINLQAFAPIFAAAVKGAKNVECALANQNAGNFDHKNRTLGGNNGSLSSASHVPLSAE